MISVGELLKNERLKKGLTLRQIEKEIRVREKFLYSIEQNDWSIFSSKIYISGIIKNYSKFLGLDTARVLPIFRRDYARIEETNFKKKVSSQYLTPQTKRYIIIGTILLFVVFFGYFTYQLVQFMSPPLVTIISPINSSVRSVDSIKVVGKTEKEASIVIYGEKVYPDKDGQFEYTLPLHVGKNELVIEVIGANGKKTVFKKVYLKD